MNSEKPKKIYLADTPKDGESKLEYIKITKLGNEIGSGYFGIVKETIFSNGNKLIRKEPVGEISANGIQNELEVYKAVKDAGMKTHKEFKTDGKNVYSTPLNINNKIALSWNNPDLEKVNKSGDILAISQFESTMERILEIKDFDIFLEGVCKESVRAFQNGISMASDSLFYIVDKDYGGKEVKIDFITGDFGEMYVLPSGQSIDNLEEVLNLLNVETGIIDFINSYVEQENIDKYINKTRLFFKIKKEEIMGRSVEW